MDTITVAIGVWIGLPTLVICGLAMLYRKLGECALCNGSKKRLTMVGTWQDCPRCHGTGRDPLA